MVLNWAPNKAQYQYGGHENDTKGSHAFEGMCLHAFEGMCVQEKGDDAFPPDFAARTALSSVGGLCDYCCCNTRAYLIQVSDQRGTCLL